MSDFNISHGFLELWDIFKKYFHELFASGYIITAKRSTGVWGYTIRHGSKYMSNITLGRPAQGQKLTSQLANAHPQAPSDRADLVRVSPPRLTSRRVLVRRHGPPCPALPVIAVSQRARP